jgi:hypothetical protein
VARCSAIRAAVRISWAVCLLGLSRWSIYGLCSALFTKILSWLAHGEDTVGKSSLCFLSAQKKTILSFFSVPQTLRWLLITPTGRGPMPGQKPAEHRPVRRLSDRGNLITEQFS